jgi:FKBP-type peptidyl-prolyl cis-trans isomerase FkpA
MRFRTGGAWVVALCAALACQPSAESPPGPTAAPATRGEQELTLYALGAAAARPLETFALSESETEHVAAGFRDALRGAPLEAAPDDRRLEIQSLQQDRRRVAVEAERQEATAFVASAAQRQGAVQTASGLVYIEVAPGEGPSPAPEDTVVVHYTGTLRDGSVFDSSVERGTPARFPLNRVIQCWQEGVGRMRAGGKARLVCPPEIAYGDSGAPPRIPGGAALEFEVELIEIDGKTPAE